MRGQELLDGLAGGHLAAVDLPRFAKNPRAQRKTYLWDPRDIAVLPTVLRRWERAIAEGDEAENAFVEARRAELVARDEAAMASALKEAA